MQQSGIDLSINAEQQNAIMHSKIDKIKLTFSTKEKPRWIHFGANDGCMLPAYFMQNLSEHDEEDFGVILAEAENFLQLDEMFVSNNNNGICLEKKNNSSIEKRIVNTVVEALKADITQFPNDWERLIQIFRNPSLQVVSLSLGEHLYTIVTSKNELLPCYEKDCTWGPSKAHTALGKITALCYERFLAGEYPLALVNFDDCTRNGSRLNEAIVGIAREWEDRCLVTSGFSEWLNEPELIAYPWTKIITTSNILSSKNIDEAISDVLKGVNNNNKPPLLILDESFKVYMEDDFPNGRLALEKTRVFFTSREEML